MVSLDFGLILSDWFERCATEQNDRQQGQREDRTGVGPSSLQRRPKHDPDSPRASDTLLVDILARRCVSHITAIIQI
jgi:hypothetical protein